MRNFALTILAGCALLSALPANADYRDRAERQTIRMEARHPVRSLLHPRQSSWMLNHPVQTQMIRRDRDLGYRTYRTF